ncbi:MAG: endolytic transglycosylase MltG [Myxococcota bacterium]
MIKWLYRLAAMCMVAAVLSIVLAVLGLVRFSQTAGPNLGVVSLEIPRGSHARAMSRLLAANGLIRHELLFYMYLRFVSGRSRDLQAGHYTFHTPLTPQQMIALLQQGKPRQVRVTIPEGASNQDIARLLHQAGLATQQQLLTAMQSPQLLRAFGVPQQQAGRPGQLLPASVEGYMYPDTYLFDAGSSPKQLLQHMHAQLQQALTPPMRQRLQQMNWSLHRLLTLASLVQQETATPSEAPRIAAVFHNRLAKNMRLQCDPTVRYGLSDFAGFYPPIASPRLRKKHLRDRHPYNTYVHKQLPPGPISSVGEQVLRAVLWPEATNLLYFVSKNDGTHVFCRTYACHKRAVKKWQLDYFRK